MKKKSRLSKLITTLGVISILAFIPLSLFLKSTESNVNIEVENLKKEIAKEENRIESLTMKVDELKSLSNLVNAIKNEGLGYNSTNIKVLSKN